MDIKHIANKASDILKKYRYVVIVVAVGIFLMTLPTGKSGKTEPVTIPAVKQDTTQEQIAEILSKISGAGRVSVMLTMAYGEETVYQSDTSISRGEGSSNEKKDTVTVTDGNRNQQGLIVQVNPPKYRGAVIVCDGADNAAVRLSVMQAVSSLTGLGADKITIVKMK